MRIRSPSLPSAETWATPQHRASGHSLARDDMHCSTVEKTGLDLGSKTTSMRPVVSSTRARAEEAYECECFGRAKLQCYASLPNGAHAECGRRNASSSEQTDFPNLSSLEQMKHFCRRCTTLANRRRPRFAETRLSSSWGILQIE